MLKGHANVLKELEWQVSNKITVNDLNKSLTSKANVADISRTFDQISKYLENRPTVQDVEASLEDKVTKDDLHLLLSRKVGIDEVKTLIEDRTSAFEFKREFNNLWTRLDEVGNELSDLCRTTPSRKEYDIIRETLDAKVSTNEFNEQLNGKASKQSVSNALHRKANKTDVEVALSHKADALLLANLQQSIDSKVETDHFDSQINHLVDTFVERKELFNLKELVSSKADKQQSET